MKPRLLVALLLGLYLASGFYVVQGNERAVVRRCGRAVTTPEGTIFAVGSGLHYDLPWPFSRIDRVNLNEVRTRTVGDAERGFEGDFLPQAGAGGRSQFLTGDKNILHVQLSVRYRISEAGLADYLYAASAPEERLVRLVEATAADGIARSGVDYVHPLGLAELRQMLTRQVRRLAEDQRLGIDVEEVAVAAVSPPLRVKADFLDVSNARADKEKYINAARAYDEQRREAARAEAREILDAAESYRDEAVEAARAAAESFVRLVEQLRREEASGRQSYVEARRMALRRRYVEVMEEVLQNVAGKVFLDSGKPVDLTIVRDPQE